MANKSEMYEDWVNRVSSFLEKTVLTLGDKRLCCSAMQSQAVLDKDIDVLFLGCNPHETDEYYGVNRDRFWTGNPYFYAERNKNNDWKIWDKLYNVLKWEGLNDTTPMEDGNYVFMNAFYFGTRKLSDLNHIKNMQEVKRTCVNFTDEVIHNIFKPKLIVCFSVKDCFDFLQRYCPFEDVQTIVPSHPNPNYHCTKTVKSAMWKGIRIIGIPHPSGRISYDDLGCVGNFLLSQYRETKGLPSVN